MGVNRTAPLAAAGCTAWLLGMALGPVVGRLLEPILTSPAVLLGSGRVVVDDLT